MVTWSRVAALAQALPGVALGRWWDNPTYSVGKVALCWLRPFSKADLARFRDAAPPSGDILAIRCESLDAKDAVLAAGLPGVFTIPHFDGFPAVLVELRRARVGDLRALLEQAHRATTAKRPRGARAASVKPARRRGR